MKRTLAIMITLAVTGLLVAGCGGPQTESSQAAIQKAQTMATIQEKTTFLVNEAQAFYNSKQFQSAVDVAQYVLRYLDKDSTAAKDLLQKAQEALTAQLQQAGAEAKKTISGFGQ